MTDFALELSDDLMFGEVCVQSLLNNSLKITVTMTALKHSVVLVVEPHVLGQTLSDGKAFVAFQALIGLFQCMAASYMSNQMIIITETL